MIYAQFYQVGCITKQIIDATGDRGVIILDGRHSVQDNKAIAESECIKRGYVGYSLHKGETFNRSSQLTAMKKVEA